MKLVRFIGYLQKHLRTVVWLGLALLALMVGLDAIPGIIHKEHAHTAVERFPGFWAGFGFVGCVVIIIVSKAFGHAGIMQREDYYDE
jgi:hypothetical protein